MSDDVFVNSLRSRVRAMNTLWQQAIGDMTLDQINHHERDGVLPIAFSFSHFMQAQDQSVSMFFLRQPTLWHSGAWASKIDVAVDALGREETVEEMQKQRFGDLDAWKQYQEEVITRTDATLDTITAAMLEEVVIPQLPPNMQNFLD